MTLWASFISSAFCICPSYFLNNWKWKQASWQNCLLVHTFMWILSLSLKLSWKAVSWVWVRCRWERSQANQPNTGKVFWQLSRLCFLLAKLKPVIFIVYNVCGPGSCEIYLQGQMSLRILLRKMAHVNCYFEIMFQDVFKISYWFFRNHLLFCLSFFLKLVLREFLPVCFDNWLHSSCVENSRFCLNSHI